MPAGDGLRRCCVAEVICMAEEATTANEVVLRGRVSGDPEERELPSGSVLVGFRVVVPREKTAMTTGSRVTSDWVACSAWGARVRKQVQSWRDGDVVEVRGALRRRHYTAAERRSSTLEVEVLGGRLVRRAPADGRQSASA
jgi:single-strand DNA-binding protein